WVKANPQQEVCVCVYCANFQLCVSAIRNSTRRSFSGDLLKSYYLCSDASEACRLKNCNNCPGENGISLQTLNIEDDEEIKVATWEGGTLVKKEVEAFVFLTEVRKWTSAHVTHEHIRAIQSSVIHEYKSCPAPRTYIVHFDFAENWTVVLPDEVQSYHWSKKQISIFTCVVTTQLERLCFAAVSEDLSHDSAHALFATQAIEEWLDENRTIATNVVYMSDGAASHFKNRFRTERLYELSKTGFVEARWIFTATGHGKSACDGVGGVLKHHATLHNMRSPPQEAIMTPQDIIHRLSTKLKGVHLLLLPAEHVSSFRAAKKQEWEGLKGVPGIQMSHMWICNATNGTRQVYMARTAKSDPKRVFSETAAFSNKDERVCLHAS
ncbi:uncharacterized protein LOC135393157, partial [Ornithodoros turicata]|uniref:uncharacterized protein LOC135393157 n=1 Tax=Ornithodoros turicata TaxID=34597 RepID=UPI0031397B08